MSLFPESTAVVMNLPESFRLEDELHSAQTIRLGTAFAHMTGWKMLSDSIYQSKATKYFLAGSSFFLTQPEVLSCWLKLCKEDKVHAALYSGKSTTTFHPKVLIVEGNSSFAIVGSGNLSRGGLKDNIECGLYTDDEFVVTQLSRWFDDLFARSARLTEATVLDYKHRWKKLHAKAVQLRQAQEALETEFNEKREASLRKWDDAVSAAKAYLSSEKYVKNYNDRLIAAKTIRTILHYPQFDFDRTAWKSFYEVLAMGRLIPIRRDRIFSKKKRLQAGLRELITGDTIKSLNDPLQPAGRYQIPGLGLNAISKILAVHSPTRWAVYNTAVGKTLRAFGYLPPRGGSPAEKYIAFTEMMDKFKTATGAEDAFALDSFFIHYYSRNLKAPPAAKAKAAALDANNLRPPRQQN